MTTADVSTALAAMRGNLFTTVAAAALLLAADERTVRRGIESGAIPSVRVSPGCVRIPVCPSCATSQA